MTRAWSWIDHAVVIAIHEEQLAQHGGGGGLRDAGLLQSALAKPQQLAAYGNPDAFDLAAAYAYGIARNHPFIDGNKRTAWVVARLFLLLHDYDRDASDDSSYLTMIQLASGQIGQEQFAAWLRANSRQR